MNDRRVECVVVLGYCLKGWYPKSRYYDLVNSYVEGQKSIVDCEGSRFKSK